MRIALTETMQISQISTEGEEAVNSDSVMSLVAPIDAAPKSNGYLDSMGFNPYSFPCRVVKRWVDISSCCLFLQMFRRPKKIGQSYGFGVGHGTRGASYERAEIALGALVARSRISTRSCR